MSYWAFSDVFEEHGIEAVPFHNEWGLVNIYVSPSWYSFMGCFLTEYCFPQGNPKPAFRAFEMLHEAGDKAAPISLDGGAPGLFATQMLDSANRTAVTTFVTVLSARQPH